MREEIKDYTIGLINDIPHDASVLMSVIICLGIIVLLKVLGIKQGQHFILSLLLVEYCFILYCSTVIYRDVQTEWKYDLTPFWSYKAVIEGQSQLIMENIMNIVAFIPIGLLTTIIFKKHGLLITLCIGLLISVGIEVLQFYFKKGFSEVDDVMHNMLGCMVGYGVRNIFRPLMLRFRR